MRFLVLSCSLARDSRSRGLARMAVEQLQSDSISVDFLDLSQVRLPFCDAGDCYGLPEVSALASRVVSASAVIVATPIYNYDVSASAKNFLELTGKAWTGKIVGFICAAGGEGSYMSVMPFANSLMLDYRCLIAPRFVYAPNNSANVLNFGDGPLRERVAELTIELQRLAVALA